MTATIETANLKAITARLLKVVEKRNTIPILANLHIEASEGSLTLRATDLDVEMEITAHAEVEDGFAATVRADALGEFARQCENGSQIRMVPAGHHMTLSSGRKRATLQTLPAGDYPSFSKVDEPNRRDIPFATLVDMLAYCTPAISTEETRYYLNGIYWHVVEGKLRAVATDGHRLAQIDGPDWPDQPAVILPRKTVGILTALNTDAKGEIGIDEAMVMVTGPDFTLRSKVVDGQFPDYTRVIPPLNPEGMTLTAPRAALAAAVSLCKMAQSKASRAIRLEPGEDSVEIFARETTERNIEVSDTIEATIVGAPVTIGFNGKYLGDWLAEDGGETITMRCTDAAAPARFTDPTRPDRLFIIMPYQV